VAVSGQAQERDRAEPQMVAWLAICKELVETGLNGKRPPTIRLAGMSLHEPHRPESRRNRNGHPSSRLHPMPMSGVLARGLVAGAVGVAAMTLAEKLEQAFTKRPNSYVPAHTLERLLGLPHRPDHERLLLNWAMHWGQGIALGAIRALMAQRGYRGPIGSFLYLNLRLLNDQTLENATGVGAPPWTWPVDEQVVDLLHKAIYAYATGAAADRLIEGPQGQTRRKSSHYYT
jgi:hypothetical protein